MYVTYDGFKNKDGFHSWADVAKKNSIVHIAI